MIDARVSAEVIELYRALVAEADRSASPSASKGNKAKLADASQTAKREEADLLPGAVSRLDAFVPERIARIEHLERELLANLTSSHEKERAEHLEREFRQFKPSPRKRTQCPACAKRSSRKSKSRNSTPILRKPKLGTRSEVEKLNAHLSQTEARHKTEVEQLRDRIFGDQSASSRQKH